MKSLSLATQNFFFFLCLCRSPAPPKSPTAEHFGDLLNELMTDFTNVSRNLKGMASVLKRDEKFIDYEKTENQRRVIQNNLDTVRYCAPLMVNLAKLQIPIGNKQALLQTIT